MAQFAALVTREKERVERLLRERREVVWKIEMARAWMVGGEEETVGQEGMGRLEELQVELRAARAEWQTGVEGSRGELGRVGEETVVRAEEMEKVCFLSLAVFVAVESGL